MSIRVQFALAVFVNLIFVGVVEAQPTDQQVAADAASFHKFRIALLAKAMEIDRHNPNKGVGAAYVGKECEKLADRTSPEFLYGIVEDLIQDTSRTEEPYLLAIMVLDNYPPEAARGVVKKLLADPKYHACDDVKNWLWEIDEAEKLRRYPSEPR
jgi:hypothetical protein